jgi:DNA-binding PadR family transcriptional regulator
MMAHEQVETYRSAHAGGLPYPAGSLRGERHGYDIMQQVKEDSRGKVKMGSGTLYGSLAAGLVVKSDIRDPRRIYYKLTALGQTTLRAESERLSAVAATARRRLRQA